MKGAMTLPDPFKNNLHSDAVPTCRSPAFADTPALTLCYDSETFIEVVLHGSVTKLGMRKVLRDSVCCP